MQSPLFKLDWFAFPAPCARMVPRIGLLHDSSALVCLRRHETKARGQVTGSKAALTHRSFDCTPI